MSLDRVWFIAKMLVSFACVAFATLFLLMPLIRPVPFHPFDLGAFGFFVILAVIPWVFVEKPPARAVGLLMLLPTAGLLMNAADLFLGIDRPLENCYHPGLPIKTQRFCAALLDIGPATSSLLLGSFCLVLGILGIWFCYHQVVKNSFSSSLPALSPVQHRGLKVASDPVMSAIEEAEFHMAYGLKKEAQQVIERALEKYPRDPRLLSKHHEVAP